jgi:hypothetical protein
MPVPRIRSYACDTKVYWRTFLDIKKVTIFIVPVLRMTNISVHSCMGTESYERLPSSGM